MTDYLKFSGETVRITRDISLHMSDGESINSVSFAVTPMTGSYLTVASVSNIRGEYTFSVTGGVEGTTYNVVPTILTSLQTLNDPFKVLVR